MSEETKLTKKQQVFVDEYLQCFNAAEAARRAGYSEKTARSIGQENLTKPDIAAEIKARMDEVHMSADKALKNLSEIADADIGVFWKVVDEWMFNPLPEYEILDEKEIIDEEAVPPKKRIYYRVRHVVLDMDKVIDPRYSHLIHEFSNSRKSGLSIKTYNRHDANRDILKVYGRFAPDKVELTGAGGKDFTLRVVREDIKPDGT